MVEEHKSTIFTVCYMFSKDQDEVNDLFQEVLINLWKGLESFKGESHIKTWIYRVSLNTCITYERKKKRDALPLEFFDRAIVLLWLESLSYEEIAAITGISVKAVSMRLLRIKRQLKDMND